MRIFFNSIGGIAGANIDWYLLEKSRVTGRSEQERSFHVFFQLLRGADAKFRGERIGSEKLRFSDSVSSQANDCYSLETRRTTGI